MKKTTLFSLVGAAAFAVPTTSHADRRIFAHVYPYQTLPAGSLELEHYLDMNLNGWDDPDSFEREEDWTQVDWRHQVELEYGITDNLDFGFYNVWSQKPFGTLNYDGIKLRSRFRFASEGELFVDPAVYLEVAYFGDAVKMEEMLILAKRLGRVEVAFNAKAEQEYELDDVAWEFEILTLLGVGYHFNHNVALALEYYGKLKVAHGEVEYLVSYLGPALSITGNGFYWTVAAQPQLGTRRESTAVQVRSLFGVTF